MKRKAFPLRIDPRVYEAVRRWADDDLRSVNAQIEFLLKEALRKAGRSITTQVDGEPEDQAASDG